MFSQLINIDGSQGLEIHNQVRESNWIFPVKFCKNSKIIAI